MTNIDAVPLSLRQLRQWCLWKSIGRNGHATKVPYQTNGMPASSTNESTWNTFDAVTKAEHSASGIGFVFASGGNLVGIDLDGCRNVSTGAIEPWAREWIIRFNSYSEVSPSQTGVKIFVQGTKPTWCGAKASVSSAPISGKSPAVEMYDRGRYFAVTGMRLSGLPTEPEPRQEVIEEFAAAFWKKQEVIAPATRDFGSDAAIADRARKYVKRITAVSGQDGHGRTFATACALVKGFGLERDIALQLLREWNETNALPKWSEKELEHKIDGACKAEGEINYLRLASPSKWDAIVLPNYSENKKSDVIVTRLDQAAIDYLEQLKNGGERLLRLGFPDVDDAIGGGCEPGELVVIGARPSHGKSMVALQAIHSVGLLGHPSVMISEEMSSRMLGKRTIQFATSVPKVRWGHDTSEVIKDLAEHFHNRAPSYVVEKCGSADRAATQIRIHADKHDCKLAVVDYAQFLSAPGKDRYEQVTNVSKIMKRVASDTGVVLLLLCQLSRKIEERKIFVPITSDLRESGQIEQDADVIMFVAWPWKIDNSKDKSLYQFFISKNRNRELTSGFVECAIDAQRQMLIANERSDANEKWDFS